MYFGRGCHKPIRSQSLWGILLDWQEIKQTGHETWIAHLKWSLYLDMTIKLVSLIGFKVWIWIWNCLLVTCSLVYLSTGDVICYYSCQTKTDNPAVYPINFLEAHCLDKLFFSHDCNILHQFHIPVFKSIHQLVWKNITLYIRRFSHIQYMETFSCHIWSIFSI